MSELPEQSLPASLGITDRDTGVAKAEEARANMTELASRSLKPSFDFGIAEMTMMSLLTRALAFHDGALDAAKADNPFAAFTLLRSYAENGAMLAWLLDHPEDIARIYPEAPRDQRLSIGRLTNNARNRFGGFQGVYEQLSGFAHPASATALSGWHAGDEERRVRWQSHTAFKNDEDFMMACVWIVELAQANAHLWRECWELYFGDPPSYIPPMWTWVGPSATQK